MKPIGFVSRDQYAVLTAAGSENGECVRLWHATNPPSRANIPVYSEETLKEVQETAKRVLAKMEEQMLSEITSLRGEIRRSEDHERDLRERIRLLLEENRKLADKQTIVTELFSG